MIVEVIDDQLAQSSVAGSAFKWSNSFGIPRLSPPWMICFQMTWNELYPGAPHKARTICTQRVFSIIDVDKASLGRER